MKRALLFLFCALMSMQMFSESGPLYADYYWYKGNKIYLERGNQEYIIYDNSLLSKSDKEKLTYTESVSYPGYTNLKWGTTEPNAVIEDEEHVLYRTPSYKGDEEGDIFVTHRFYVKLKDTEDLSVLQNMAAQYNAEIEEVDNALPLWYVLRCGLPSDFNAMELANIFYESGLFLATEPEMIGGLRLDDGATKWKDIWCDTWNVAMMYSVGPDKQVATYRYQLMQDTVVDGQTYTVLNCKATAEPNTLNLDLGMVRFADDKKVYANYGGTEYLVYDFSVQVDDTLDVLINAWGDDTQKCLVHNVSIDEESNRTIVTLYVYDEYDGVFIKDDFFAIKWIEGVGSENGFFEGVEKFVDGGGAKHLFCAYQGDELKYTGPFYENYGCEYNTATNVEDVTTPTSPFSKILHNGQLFILRDGKTYNVMGVEVTK